MTSYRSILGAFCALLVATTVCAATRLPSVFGDHMVLQRNMPCPVWGWDDPGQEITVSFAGQKHEVVTNSEGHWRVVLDDMAASAAPRQLTVTGSSRVALNDVLVGEVWVCAGQSNMAFEIRRAWDADIERIAARNPQLRMLRVPSVGSQEPQSDFEGSWQLTQPDTVAEFSAIGYQFGNSLQRILGVPVGLINNAWGGSAVETWIPRDVLETDPRLVDFMQNLIKHEAYLQTPAAGDEHVAKLAAWEQRVSEAKAQGVRPPRRPQSPTEWMASNKRPANGYGGSLYPILGYAMKGVIWYQGEGNATRASSYYDLFPAMIETWREQWGQGDFPFYWVQLPNFMKKSDFPGDAAWAELREAQTLTQKLPHTGQAVIMNLGEANDIHPHDKLPVARRLLRLALHHDYGYTDLAYRSPEYREHVVQNDRMVITLDCFGGRLSTFDTDEVLGFAICGENRNWHWAEAKIIGDNQVEVWSEEVTSPVAVRYAWANNPDCNLITFDGLPATPFRTDDFPLTTAPSFY